MDILVQIVNGLDKGSAYALIALGLTLTFGTLGIVNFAHGALFMVGAFVAVTFHNLLNISEKVRDTSITFFEAYKEVPYINLWFPDAGPIIIDWAVPISILFTIPVMVLIGWILERGLIQFFYKRSHAEQILVTFGLAIVLQEIVRGFFGSNPLPMPAPEMFSGSLNLGALFGIGDLMYPWWRIIYFFSALVIIAAVFFFLKYTTFGLVVRAGMRDRETVGLLGIDIEKRFTIVFAIAAVVVGLAGLLYSPIQPPDYHMGMNFLVLSFIVVVVGGMGSLEGAVVAGFLLGMLQSFAAMNGIKDLMPGLDQIIIYLVAIIVILVRPRGLMGRKGIMED